MPERTAVRLTNRGTYGTYDIGFFHPSIPQRLLRLKHVLDTRLRLRLLNQLEKDLSLEFQEILLRHFLRGRELATRHHECQSIRQEGVVFRDETALHVLLHHDCKGRLCRLAQNLHSSPRWRIVSLVRQLPDQFARDEEATDRKSTRLNSSHVKSSY